MAIIVKVAGIDRTEEWQRTADTSWEDPLNGRGTGRIRFGDAVGAFAPSDGQSFEIIDGGVTAFAGILMEPDQHEPEKAGFVMYDCQLADFNILADRRTVGENFDNIAIELIVSGIVTDHMAGEGISLAGVETGPTLTSLNPNIKATESFNDLSDQTGRAWYIDLDAVTGLTMNMHARTSISAPAIVDGDMALLGTVKVREDRQKYRNEQIIRAGSDEFPILAVSGNLPEQVARASIEDTAGIYSDVQTFPEILNQDIALEKAGDLLDRFSKITKVVTLQTRTAGFRAGQSATVNFPNHNVNNEVMLIDNVTARVVTLRTDAGDTQEIWYTLSCITGDPFGGWLEHFRKVPPVKGLLRFANEPGLFRIDPQPGAMVHDPLPDDFLWFQGAQSGTLDFTPSAIGVTHQSDDLGGGGFKVDVRRGPVASPRQQLCELYAIDDNEKIATSPSTTFTADELVGSSLKKSMIIKPDNTKIVIVERDPGFSPRLRVIDIAGAGFQGSVVATGMPDNNNPVEGAWVGDFVFWPDTTNGSIFIFDVSDPNNPTLDNEFSTSLSICQSCVPSTDGNSLYATGTGTGLVVAIDISDPTAPTEDDTQVTAGQYASLDIDDTDAQLIMFVRADANNIRYARIDVTAGTTLTLLDEALVPLATSVMVGVSTIYQIGSAITFRERPAPTSPNAQRAHVFDVDAVDGVTFRETLSYNHGASGNLGPERSYIGNRIIHQFNSNTDAEITFGEVEFQEAVPLTIDRPLRVGFGGMGTAKYLKGDITYADRDLPDNNRGEGELSRLPIGSELEFLLISGGLPAWGALSDLPQEPLTADLDMAGFLFDNAPGLRGHIDGFETSTAADANHDITVPPGVCTDSLANNDKVIELTSALTKRIDAAFAEGNNLGGMATGTVAADTEYNLIIIEKDSDGTIDMIFDVSATGANKPAGWTARRRIGSVFTNGSSNIRDYTQNGDWFWYQDPIVDVSDATGTNDVFETGTLSVPANSIAIAYCFGRTSSANDAGISVREVGSSVEASGDEAMAHYADGGGATGTRSTIAFGFIQTDSSSQVEYAITDPTWSSARIRTIGWIDQRGRNE